MPFLKVLVLPRTLLTLGFANNFFYRVPRFLHILLTAIKLSQVIKLFRLFLSEFQIKICRSYISFNFR